MKQALELLFHVVSLKSYLGHEIFEAPGAYCFTDSESHSKL